MLRRSRAQASRRAWSKPVAVEIREVKREALYNKRRALCTGEHPLNGDNVNRLRKTKQSTSFAAHKIARL